MSAYDLLPCTDEQHNSNTDCRYAHERLALESRIVRSLIRGLKRDGWLPTLVNDGGDDLVKVTNETEAMDAVFAVDESALGFSKGDEHESFMIVLGNGIDCICDWTMGDNNFSALMDVMIDNIYERDGEC